MNDPVDNPNLISGIHNYCDRWCERCQFTSRCAVYAIEEADPDVNPAARDITNEAFWQKLAAIFAETHAMISAIAEERGIDLSEEALEPIRQRKETERDNARNHPLGLAAEEYAHAVSQWFEQDSSKQELVSDMLDEVNLEQKADDDEDEFVAVIRWYQFFIAAKLIRALVSSVDEDDYLVEESGRDSDGSAKAALIGIDRSISAWRLMYDSRGEHAAQSDMIKKLLLDLEKLRLGAEETFPDARDFIRPGFDEASLDVLH
ncbi:MAG TPA: hypothetical protein VNO50_04080 [Pyrinomonadaceae bacterium]|nr:hypothetical protein [Pyrinomonadaceae bacterium]